MIKFFGRGSGFSDNHNTAFFYYKKSLVLMDCSMMAFIKMKNYGLESVADGQEVERIVVAVTHTHSDHVAGIPMLVHYARFVWHVKITIIAPSEAVKDNLRYYLTEMEGCDRDTFVLVTADEYRQKYATSYPGTSWLDAVIPTEHTPELSAYFGEKTLQQGLDYIVTGYENNTNAGSAEAIVEGTGNFTGTKRVAFMIDPQPIAKDAVSNMEDQIYTGEEFTPVPEVYAGTLLLTEGLDYIIKEYSGNRNAGPPGRSPRIWQRPSRIKRTQGKRSFPR